MHGLSRLGGDAAAATGGGELAEAAAGEGPSAAEAGGAGDTRSASPTEGAPAAGTAAVCDGNAVVYGQLESRCRAG